MWVWWRSSKEWGDEGTFKWNSWALKFWGHFQYSQPSFHGTEDKNILAPLKKALFLWLLTAWANSCVEVTFWEEKQGLMSPSDFAVLFTSHLLSPDSVSAEWVSKFFTVIFSAQFLALRRPWIRVCLVVLNWLGWIEESEAIGRT